MTDSKAAPTPVTILTGFLGAGKTTLILSLLPQLPPEYKLALLKNEFGDVAIDSQLAARSSIAGVQELLNGCICCNLVGQLGDALQTLRDGIDPSAREEDGGAALQSNAKRPDRIIIETSGSAFPATLAMEVNRLARETGNFTLDGVVSVIDVENWQGYEDTSITAKMQARYTDLIVLNKWELVSERRLDDVLDRVGDLEVDPPIPCIKSEAGRVDREAVLGLDGALAQQLELADGDSQHTHSHDHQSEVEVISATLGGKGGCTGLEVGGIMKLLETAPKDEVYRIKAMVLCSGVLKSSDGEPAINSASHEQRQPQSYILNWAFGRWTFTWLGGPEAGIDRSALRMTIVTARSESTKWLNRIQDQKLLRLEGNDSQEVEIRRVT